MQAAFPALGMGMVGFALVYGNDLFLYIAVGLVFLGILMVIGMRWSQARSVQKRRRNNRRKYRAYLNSVERAPTSGLPCCAHGPGSVQTPASWPHS